DYYCYSPDSSGNQLF
nr:immunoglobulin light chain junction region [Macaca mulatta]MOW66149.1 immunoglobulin light chain junction region [Macaca mulatta]MOW66996.1 immunoglobulin light chain junction region [Macaca mulatta]MOW68654.1 immunoglobulin light chain junction region [Macaca mulatta]MOW71755.1 immunoglobulin light chain junction region [Macaca mulatta]